MSNARVQVGALVRRAQEVEAPAVVVKAIGCREVVEIAGARIVRIEHRGVNAIVQHAVVKRDAGAASKARAEDEASLRREARATRPRYITTGRARIRKL